MSAYVWSDCRTCHSAYHHLQDAQADIRKLLRRAEAGRDVSVPLAAAKVVAQMCRTALDAHQKLGHGAEVPNGALPQGS